MLMLIDFLIWLYKPTTNISPKLFDFWLWTLWPHIVPFLSGPRSGWFNIYDAKPNFSFPLSDLNLYGNPYTQTASINSSKTVATRLKFVSCVIKLDWSMLMKLENLAYLHISVLAGRHTWKVCSIGLYH